MSDQLTITIWQCLVSDEWRHCTPEVAAYVAESRPGALRLVDVPADTDFTLRKHFKRVSEDRTITPRRLAAAARALKHQRDKAGLFAHLVAAEQPTPLERVEKMDANAVISEQETRDAYARMVRDCRRLIAQLDPVQRGYLAHEWNGNFYPKTADWLRTFIKHKTEGRYE